ncbi:MAG TPA: SAM-dependent methyltransferase [Candidatus Mediterraneibacter quadrami]|uniref:SAM-dependent methyltransferase n=1 Tax=Candidatus Mediterraneibacter quadrami TaxID=2838684 RepID=A0A9D2RDT4_9FIRM|nr:SAM-dependent methyltransferase [Candidatus Mediterraneibacter quadrami]
MKELLTLFNTVLNKDFIRAVISNPREKGGIVKVKIRPLELKGQLVFQFESFTAKQAFHKNLDRDAAVRELSGCAGEFRQMLIETADAEYTVLISKKGKATIKRKQRREKAQAADLSHNRQKRYILEEGKYVPFLRDLGVMTEDGKIVRSRTDKFRQINRFLEFIEDILPQLDRDRELTILDFGCGKSYLTFAMYYYLHELSGYDIRIVGLDLKEDVIRHCSRLAEQYGYDKLTFLTGDIADYDGVDQVDMVVTLHACDTATDYALAKAVGWNAKVSLSVPCCQHELNAQFSAGGGSGDGLLAPVMDYGLLRERFAALVTDGLRAKYLERAGYETQVLEFIDMEHTPKNILLRAVRRNGDKIKNTAAESAAVRRAADDIVKCEQFLQASPTLGRLLSDIEGE